MKSLLLLLAVLPACQKMNDATALQHEAATLAKYYQAKLDMLDKRANAIFERGKTIPATLPGIEPVGKRLNHAVDAIKQLRAVVGLGPDHKSAVEKQAEAAAKNNKVDDLEKLIYDTEHIAEYSMVVINDDLTAVESWIVQYDRIAA